MKQKKVNSLLKGVAGVGAALGGAAAFTDADVVYADELEGKKGNEGGEETILTQEEASESAAEVLSTSTKNEESASNSYSEVELTSSCVCCDCDSSVSTASPSCSDCANTSSASFA